MTPYASLRSLKRRLFLRSEGVAELKARYARMFGRPLDCANPRTFTEKLFVRMVEMHRHPNPLFTRLADKYEVRQYVREKVGAQYLTGLFWHGQDPRAIPFDALPECYAIKTNHGSGRNIIVRGPADRAAILEHFSRALRQNYYWVAREYHYYAIRPRLLIEELIDDGQPDGPLDYRFWCFGGSPRLVQVDNHSHSINPFYDVDWSKLQLAYRSRAADADIARPDGLHELLRVAGALSADLDFARVDLYCARGRVLVGEITLTPVAGHLKFMPSSWDAVLGRMWVSASVQRRGESHLAPQR
ncbi:MAG TPA: ATP-grasp fold amidoligase family protein [Steroidobacteraceae bacterium]